MIYGITKYSPLDIDTLLAGRSRTLSPSEKSDFFITFSHVEKFKSKNSIVFNSLEYCQKRTDIVILDGDKETLDNVVSKIKASK